MFCLFIRPAIKYLILFMFSVLIPAIMYGIYNKVTLISIAADNYGSKLKPRNLHLPRVLVVCFGIPLRHPGLSFKKLHSAENRQFVLVFVWTVNNNATGIMAILFGFGGDVSIRDDHFIDYLQQQDASVDVYRDYRLLFLLDCP